MAEAKTKPTKANVNAFLDSIDDERRRKDCKAVLKLMKDVTQAQPEMWGSSIVGFGRYRYNYDSGREGEWMMTGFAPRKGDLTLYIMAGFERIPELMKRLGKFKTGKSCLYVKKLEDVDMDVLRDIVSKSVEKMSANRIDK
jgi:Domain of unknown function (DU1801)